MTTTYAIASDLSDIVETTDNFGKFMTKLEAVEHWIGYLEDERIVTAEQIARAKRLRRKLLKGGETSDQRR